MATTLRFRLRWVESYACYSNPNIHVHNFRGNLSNCTVMQCAGNFGGFVIQPRRLARDAAFYEKWRAAESGLTALLRNEPNNVNEMDIFRFLIQVNASYKMTNVLAKRLLHVDKLAGYMQSSHILS